MAARTRVASMVYRVLGCCFKLQMYSVAKVKNMKEAAVMGWNFDPEKVIEL